MTTANERVREAFAKGKRHKPGNGKDAAPLRIVTFAEAELRIDAPYLVKDWLHAGELSAIIGPPACGKTFLALDLDAHIAAGAAWFGHRVRQAAVVHLAAEGGAAIFNRIAAMKARLGFDDSLPLAIVPASLDLVQGGDADSLAATIAHAAARFGQPVGKLTIDTVSRVLAGADENAPEGMGALIRNVDRIRAATNCHATLVHHAPKDGQRGKGGRGHSSLWGAIDTEIDVDRDIATKIATARVVKQRNGIEGAEVAFELESVLLGTDSDGDAVSSCIIVPATGDKQPINVKLSATCAIALAALRQAVEEGGEIPPASAHIPANVRTVHVELWRKFAYARNITDGEAKSAKRMAFNRAAGQLQARGLVGGWQGIVWPIGTSQ